MVWPDHTKMNQTNSARSFLDDIISIGKQRIDDPKIGKIAGHRYEMIRGHAYLDRENDAHGKLRDFVNQDGTGVGNTAAEKHASLDAAWDNVRAAYDLVALPSPTLKQLQDAIKAIRHG